MTALVAPLSAISDWLHGLAVDTPVWFPQPYGKRSFRFERLGPDSAVTFDAYVPTTMPAGSRILPAETELFRYRATPTGDVQITPTLQTEPQILAGVRACDIRGIFLRHRVHAEGTPDPVYLARRAATRIIGVACVTPCDGKCFCEAVGALDHREGADVFLTPAGALWLVEPLTEDGEGLMASLAGDACEDPDGVRALALAVRPSPFGRPLPPLDKVTAAVKSHWASPIWHQHTARCFSCGTCTIVCPTCYCFEVLDEYDLDDRGAGARRRCADSCMLPRFAAVAGNHNFRSHPSARQRHRIKRKFQYLDARMGEGAWCTGCGRCGRQCTTHIDIYDIVTDLVHAAEERQ